MNLLSISTSAKIPSAALKIGDGEIKLLSDASVKPHSVSLMGLIESLLDGEKIKVSDMDAFCVDVGPGSFTGVRIGVSVVNALAFATGKPVIPISSLAAVRHTAPQGCGVVCAMLDARGGKGYAAVYLDDATLIEPCACIQSETVSRLEKEYGDYVIVGDCFGGTSFVNAELVMREALRRWRLDGDGIFTDHAVPMYLRPSQAERMREQAAPSQI